MADDDATYLAAAILLGHAMGTDARREATEAEVQSAVSNAEKLRGEMEKRRSERVKKQTYGVIDDLKRRHGAGET